MLASTSSRTTSHSASPTIGDAAPDPAIFISARTAWSTTVLSSVATPQFLWPTTPSPTSSASTSRKNPALPTAPSPACTTLRWSTSGAPLRLSRHTRFSVPPVPSPNWFRSNNAGKNLSWQTSFRFPSTHDISPFLKQPTDCNQQLCLYNFSHVPDC